MKITAVRLLRGEMFLFVHERDAYIALDLFPDASSLRSQPNLLPAAPCPSVLIYSALLLPPVLLIQAGHHQARAVLERAHRAAASSGVRMDDVF